MACSARDQELFKLKLLEQLDEVVVPQPFVRIIGQKPYELGKKLLSEPGGI